MATRTRTELDRWTRSRRCLRVGDERKCEVWRSLSDLWRKRTKIWWRRRCHTRETFGSWRGLILSPATWGIYIFPNILCVLICFNLHVWLFGWKKLISNIKYIYIYIVINFTPTVQEIECKTDFVPKKKITGNQILTGLNLAKKKGECKNFNAILNLEKEVHILFF